MFFSTIESNNQITIIVSTAAERLVVDIWNIPKRRAQVNFLVVRYPKYDLS